MFRSAIHRVAYSLVRRSAPSAIRQMAQIPLAAPRTFASRISLKSALLVGSGLTVGGMTYMFRNELRLLDDTFVSIDAHEKNEEGNMKKTRAQERDETMENSRKDDVIMNLVSQLYLLEHQDRTNDPSFKKQDYTKVLFDLYDILMLHTVGSEDTTSISPQVILLATEASVRSFTLLHMSRPAYDVAVRGWDRFCRSEHALDKSWMKPQDFKSLYFLLMLVSLGPDTTNSDAMAQHSRTSLPAVFTELLAMKAGDIDLLSLSLALLIDALMTPDVFSRVTPGMLAQTKYYIRQSQMQAQVPMALTQAVERYNLGSVPKDVLKECARALDVDLHT